MTDRNSSGVRRAVHLLPLAYALLVVIGIVMGSLQQFELIASWGGVMVLWLTFPWALALFLIPHQVPGIVDHVVLPLSAGLLNALVLYLLLRHWQPRRSDDIVAAR